jgi:putative membrane protein
VLQGFGSDTYVQLKCVVGLMMDTGATLYLWVKALHIIAVIAWMAGLLYLPRLFAYHCSAAPSALLKETFSTMERRLLRFIMGPAMAASWALGLALIYLSPHTVWQEVWFYGKFLAVVTMSGMHGAMVVWQRGFENDSNRRGPRFYKMMNEVPTVLMIVIVLMVVIKPF